MKAALLAQFPHLNLTVLAMLLFAAIFSGWCWYAFGKKRKAQFETLSRLPLED